VLGCCHLPLTAVLEAPMTAEKIRGFLDGKTHLRLRIGKARVLLATDLAQFVNYWSLQDMQYFVEEMRGLDLSKSEDRDLFCHFFCLWFKEEMHESSDA